MNYMNIQPPSPINALITALTWPVKFTTYTSSLWRLWPCSVIIRDAGTRKGPGGGADFVEGHRKNFNYVKIHTLESRGSVAFFLRQILTDHILRVAFQLSVFYTYVHAFKCLTSSN